MIKTNCSSRATKRPGKKNQRETVFTLAPLEVGSFVSPLRHHKCRNLTSRILDEPKKEVKSHKRRFQIDFLMNSLQYELLLL